MPWESKLLGYEHLFTKFIPSSHLRTSSPNCAVYASLVVVLELNFISFGFTWFVQMDRILAAYRKSSKQWSSTMNKLAQGETCIFSSSYFVFNEFLMFL